MLNRVNIKNFKCFREIEIKLSNFNILCGTNSSGKSSFIQSLLLVSQNQSSREKCILNGNELKLGKFSEVKNFDIGQNNNISIKCEYNNEKIDYIEFDEDLKFVCEKKDLNLISEKNFFYISAGRTGCSDTYEDSEDNIKFGKKGEFCISFLNRNRNEELPQEYIYDKETPNTLEYQVNYWLKRIVGSEINVSEINNTTKLVATYSNLENKYVRSYNTGSGLSYMISILIMCLGICICKETDNNIIIIENPEIHLHPKAQSELAKFLMFMSTKNQIIVETHSDHIFNAYRLALKNKFIKKDMSKVYYFEREKSEAKAKYIEFTETGKILTRETGLFDQFDIDLEELICRI